MTSGAVYKSLLFIIWIVAIIALSGVPYPKNGGVSFKLTKYGMIMHFAAYFVAMALFYWAYKKNNVLSILYSCLSIFMFSVALEIVQLYLPYRTFNPVDIAANGFGIFFFVIIWMVCWKKRTTEI
ncbi:MAG: VanZ family protein [Candidatus Neomarinimicrobiota bacterium]